MGRRKGSKNKPKNPETIVIDSVPQAVESSTEPVKPKRHRRTKAEMEAYRASLKAQENAVNNAQTSLEGMLETSLNTSLVDKPVLIDTENTEERLNNFAQKLQETSQATPVTEETVEETKNAIEEAKKEIVKNKNKNKKQSQYPLCDCCGKEIYCTPNKIDTNILCAQVAQYHRQSPRWVVLCKECAEELSDVVDRWLAGNGCLTALEKRELERKMEKEK